MHMIMNNLDPRVAQFPQELVTYGGNGQVFSNWAQVNSIGTTIRWIHIQLKSSALKKPLTRVMLTVKMMKRANLNERIEI